MFQKDACTTTLPVPLKGNHFQPCKADESVSPRKRFVCFAYFVVKKKSDHRPRKT